MRTLVPLSAKLGLGPGSSRILCSLPRDFRETPRPSVPPPKQPTTLPNGLESSMTSTALAVLFPILALRVWPSLACALLPNRSPHLVVL